MLGRLRRRCRASGEEPKGDRTTKTLRHKKTVHQVVHQENRDDGPEYALSHRCWHGSSGRLGCGGFGSEVRTSGEQAYSSGDNSSISPKRAARWSALGHEFLHHLLT